MSTLFSGYKVLKFENIFLSIFGIVKANWLKLIDIHRLQMKVSRHFLIYSWEQIWWITVSRFLIKINTLSVWAGKKNVMFC